MKKLIIKSKVLFLVLLVSSCGLIPKKPVNVENIESLIKLIAEKGLGEVTVEYPGWYSNEYIKLTIKTDGSTVRVPIKK